MIWWMGESGTNWNADILLSDSKGDGVFHVFTDGFVEGGSADFSSVDGVAALEFAVIDFAVDQAGGSGAVDLVEVVDPAACVCVADHGCVTGSGIVNRHTVAFAVHNGTEANDSSGSGVVGVDFICSFGTVVDKQLRNTVFVNVHNLVITGFSTHISVVSVGSSTVFGRSCRSRNSHSQTQNCG